LKAWAVKKKEKNECERERQRDGLVDGEGGLERYGRQLIEAKI